jgi:preprotein translocase subunit SecF
MKEDLSHKAARLFIGLLFGCLIFGVHARPSLAMGVSTGVNDNPYNTTAQQLAEKEKRIKEQEMRLQQIEQKVISNSQVSRQLMLTAVGGVIVLFVLIFINYYLDYQRQKREENGNDSK